MIESINLKCFRKHELMSLTLTEGLQTLRGPNEGGKTTILEGAAYALFGSKALRNSLAETVTWGHKDTELEAKVTLRANGKLYNFVRSKAGAEVYNGGTEPFVTGQTEVSNFAAELLGADVNVAHHLMLSGQGGLRGVLDQGPKATSTLIETLSDLDLIDRIVDAASEKLQLGSTVVQADRLKVAEEALATTVQPEAPTAPDLTSLQAELATLNAQLVPALEAQKAAEAIFVAEEEKRAKAAQLQMTLDGLNGQVKDVQGKQGDLRAAAEATVEDPAPIRAAVADAEDWDNKARAWAVFKSLPLPEMTLPVAAFESLNARLTAKVTSLRNTVNENVQRIKVIEPQLATTHACPACGQDTAHLEHVKQAQAKLAAELEAARAYLESAQRDLPEAEADMAELNELIKIGLQQAKALPRLGNYVTVDGTRAPMVITWNGPDFGESAGPDAESYRRQLTQVEAAIQARSKAQAQLETLGSVLADLNTRQAAIAADIAALNLVSSEDHFEMGVTFSQAANEVTRLQGLVAMTTLLIEDSERQYKEAKAAYDLAMSKIDGLKQTVTTLLADIEVVEFNNQLVKKVRAARPVIANKLWNLVLTTVSTLFSQMRGDTSIVTKAKEGFMVNGKPVESLSGSTLDILGLAIRCALIKTFVPNCPFLILDEPSAACDADRSAALIGFVAAAGFQQVILVTHEDTSESLATNLIQL